MCDRSRHGGAALLAICLALLPLVASANAMPSQSVPGSVGLVVPTSTRDVRIEREHLSFDLTGGQQALVRATYELVNTAAKEVALDLLFVAPGSKDFAVTLDGSPIQVSGPVKASLPEEWTASRRGVDPRTGAEYEMPEYVANYSRNQTWSFPLRLGPGQRGTLAAEYEAVLGYDNQRADYVLRHLMYVLGPANNWGGFGTLEVSATLPSQYVFGSSPPLAKVGEADGVARYAATFQGIPTEVLRLSTMRVPSPYATWLAPLEFGLPLAAALAIGIVCGLVGKRIRRAWLAWLAAGTAAFLATMVLAPGAVMLATSVEPLASAGEDLTGRLGYGYTTLLLLWMLMLAPLLASLVGGLWAAVGSVRAARRMRPLAGQG